MFTKQDEQEAHAIFKKAEIKTKDANFLRNRVGRAIIGRRIGSRYVRPAR